MINMEKFSFAADSIDQDRIPQFLLSDGNKMPCIGYGTFGSDHVEPGVIAENVKVAHLDIVCSTVLQPMKMKRKLV